MIGSLYAILSAIFFALNGIATRRAVLKVSNASIGILISVPVALPFLLLILAVTGQLDRIVRFSWQSYVWLSAAGILHFVVGRSLMYDCVKLAGANVAGLLRRIDILVSVVIGVYLLHEPFSWELAIGVLLIMIGITLAGLNTQMFRSSGSQNLKIPVKAIVLGFGCGLAWGITPIFIKLGLKDAGSPVAGTFISFLAATLVLSIFWLNQRERISAARMSGRAVVMFILAGMLAFIATLTRYIALSLAPASVVVPLVSISPIFLLILSFLINRDLEIFSRTIVIGTVAVVIGTILLV